MILVTGSSGYIGKYIIDGHGVDKKAGVDISDVNWNPIADYKTIVHLAAASNVRCQWDECLRDNINATYNVIKKNPGAKIIFASSCAASHTASHWYGKSKAICEDMIRASGVKYTIFRLYNVAGFDDPNPHLIPNAMKAARTGEPLHVYGNCIRDYVHINDVIREIDNAIGGMYDNQTIDIGTGIGYSTLDVLSMVEHVIGKKINKVMLPSKQEDAVLVCPEKRKYSNLESIIRSAL
jgi:nucleoside-diphosphate-sugar epimerase